MKNLALHWKIIIGLVLGIIYAFVASALGWNQFTKDWIDPFGQIFINLLKFIAIPLVLFSIVAGIASLKDISKLGRMGAKTLGMYLVTTLFAVGLGLLLVNVFKPGEFIDDNQRMKNRVAYEQWAEGEKIPTADGQQMIDRPEFAALKAEVQAEEAAFKASYEAVVEKKDNKEKLSDTEKAILRKGDDLKKAQGKIATAKKEQGPLQPLIDVVPTNIVNSLAGNGSMLQIIFFAIFFGVVLALLEKRIAEPVINLVDGLNEVFLKMVDLVMKAAPYFVFALMAGVLSKMADSPAEVFEIFKGLLSYSLTVFFGLVLMIFLVYPTLVTTLVKKISYTRFFRNISPAQFLAFSTSSSAATLPVTMECVEERMGVSPNVTGFVLPIGATVNMDGTSLYQAVAVIFLAQMHMVDLDFTQQLTIVLTATLASIGSAAVPSAGLIMLIIVLQSVGLNPLWIAIIFPVDRILDMCRTVVNVTGDASVSTIIAQSEGELNVPVE